MTFRLFSCTLVRIIFNNNNTNNTNNFEASIFELLEKEFCSSEEKTEKIVRKDRSIHVHLHQMLLRIAITCDYCFLF